MTKWNIPFRRNIITGAPAYSGCPSFSGPSGRLNQLRALKPVYKLYSLTLTALLQMLCGRSMLRPDELKLKALA